MTMRVLFWESTGGVGMLLAEEALRVGHVVVIYACSTEKLPESLQNNSQVIIHEGQLADAQALSEAMQSLDVPVCPGCAFGSQGRAASTCLFPCYSVDEGAG